MAITISTHQRYYVKGPKNGVVKASFAGCPISDRKVFDLSRGMLLISIGQSYHEGEKFEATLELVNRKFKCCTLMLADTLQRHNIQAQEGLGTDEAYLESLKRCDDWLERNQAAIHNFLDIPFNVVRWNEYLDHPDFDAKLKFIDSFYRDAGFFYESVDSTVNEYMNRGNRAELPEDRQHFLRENCLRYLLEECAVMLLWWEKDGFEFEVYPTKRNAAMSAVFDQIISPADPSILRPVNLRFKRYAKHPEEILEQN